MSETKGKWLTLKPKAHDGCTIKEYQFNTLRVSFNL